jgi:hypothetical protein
MIHIDIIIIFLAMLFNLFEFIQLLSIVLFHFKDIKIYLKIYKNKFIFINIFAPIIPILLLAFLCDRILLKTKNFNFYFNIFLIATIYINLIYIYQS